MITKQQIEYLLLWHGGATMKEIAEKCSANRSTVSRVIKRASRHVCPFSSDCTKCPLPGCAIKEEYSNLVNNTEDARCSDKRRTAKRV